MIADVTAHPRQLLLFTKPAHPGRVKTRLIGALSPEQAAELHAAFVADAVARLRRGRFDLAIAWALAPEEPMPDPFGLPGVRQRGADLGTRLFTALEDAARTANAVAALGSDHPTVAVEQVEEAFARIEAGADVVLGPAKDGGYTLIALAATAVHPRLFADVAWSTETVLGTTLERAGEVGLRWETLASGHDVDTPADLERLCREMASSDLGCPRTRALLASWGRLPSVEAAAVTA